jgi:hypothetical protein
VSRRDHFEHPLFTGEERVCAFPVVDAGVQNEPPYDSTACVMRRKTSNLEPPVRTTGASNAVFGLVRLPELDGLHTRRRSRLEGHQDEPRPWPSTP